MGPRRLVIVTTEFALCSRNRNVRFQKTRKNSEIIEVAGPLSQRCEPSGIENKENNSTQNENEWRYPAKGENITVREPKNTRRLWGYKGIRIGEASHPGPELNEDTEIYEGKRGMAMGEAFKDAADLQSSTTTEYGKETT